MKLFTIFLGAAHAITGYRFASAPRRIKREIRKKNWARAKALLEDPKAHISERVRATILESALFEDEIKTNVEPADRVQDRLKGVNSGYDVKRTRKIGGGIISLGMYVHEVSAPTGEYLRILEKIYSKRRKSQAESEILLFEAIPSSKLHAPIYYGNVDSGNYLSIFYEFIEQSPLEKARRRLRPGPDHPLIEDAVFELWRQRPDAEAISALEERKPGLPNFLEIMLDRKRYPFPLKDDAAGEGEALFSRVLSKRDALVSMFRSQPAFILKGDLYNPSNLLRKRGGPTVLIDWDKWYIANIGAGIKIPPALYQNPRLDARLVSFCASGQDLDRRRIWRNIAMYNLADCLRNARWKDAAEWWGLIEPWSGA